MTTSLEVITRMRAEDAVHLPHRLPAAPAGGVSRREVGVSLAAFALQTPRDGFAQTSPIPRLGRLTLGRAADVTGLRYLQGFVEELRKLGWSEGKNVAFDRRFGEDDVALLRRQARELVDAKVDVIVCATSLEAEVAIAAGATMPIVMQVGVNPIERGLIASYARPGGIVTGTSWDQAPEISAKYPELLKEAYPGLTRLGGLYDAGFPGLDVYRRVIEGAARRLGMTTHHAEVRVGGDFESAFADLSAHDVQAVWVYGSQLIRANLARIVQFCASRRWPDMYIFKEAVALGGLMSYGVDIASLHRRAAYYVDKILRGAKPADLPVEMPTRYELVVNLKTAKARGLKIPRSLLLRADELIE